MVLASTQFNRLSGSSKQALGWARASARVRQSSDDDVPADVPDLLIGVVLAHPDAEAEGRALLSHFGLTIRDLLPPDYPPFTKERLRRHAAGIGTSAPPDLTDPALEVISIADRSATGREIHVRNILGALLEARTPLETKFQERLGDMGTDLTQLVESYRRWLTSQNPDAAGMERAGRELKAMLDREHPLRPASVPRYAADRTADGSDLIGVTAEVDAFAYLLASKALNPPLAVGLFGDWGAGKSFFMDAVRRRIEAIVDAQKNDASAEAHMFSGSVKQIEFNAWQYVQGSLWASLLEHILAELDGAPLSQLDARRRDVETKLEHARDEEKQQTASLETLDTELERLRTALSNAQAERTTAFQEAETKRKDAVGETMGSARDLVGSILGSKRKDLLGEDADKVLSALADARAESSRARALMGRYWTWRHIIIATLAAVLIPAAAAGLHYVVGLPPVVTLLGALSLIVPLVTAGLEAVTRWSQAQIAAVEKARAGVEAQLAALDDDVVKAQREVDEKEREIADAEEVKQQAQVETGELTVRLQELTPARVLGEFIQERSRSDDYRKYLGLLGVVREDLRDLEQLVRDHNRDPEENPLENPPPNRIILYIDDLDRCSSTKVLEVLEAVHLLLAFDLFVVVVAVDARWLSHALTSELGALRKSTNGLPQPVPRDYLEKIFQLPFWVQPIAPEGRRSLVRGLLEGTVEVEAQAQNGDGARGGNLSVGQTQEQVLDTMLARRSPNARLGARQLSLLPSELAFIESLAPLLGDTPRRVKRFINATQLLLAMPSPPGAGAQPPERHIVAFASALQAGLPHVARELFAAARDGGGQGATLESLLADPLTLQGATSAQMERERDRLRDWLSDSQTDRKVWRDLNVKRLRVRADIISRLSFERESLLV